MAPNHLQHLMPTCASDPLAGTLRINEIFHSIQGESTWAGVPCVFVRLAGCPLRCTYCDTEYAFREGSTSPIRDVVDRVLSFGCPVVELMGGEPLAQQRSFDLVRALCDRGLTVLIETSGAVDISPCDPRAIRILDVKTPGSGESSRNRLENLADLRARDEVKFVVVDRADYEWSREFIGAHGLAARVRDGTLGAVLLSAAWEQPRGTEIAGCPGLPPRDLARWILEDRLPVRMQSQLHKVIWDPRTRGV